MTAIAEVTVLEARAAVTRRGTVKLAGGQQRVVIERVAPVLADKTLTATCTNARVLDVRCERYVAPWREGAPAEATTLREERTRLEATASCVSRLAIAASISASCAWRSAASKNASFTCCLRP